MVVLHRREGISWRSEVVFCANFRNTLRLCPLFRLGRSPLALSSKMSSQKKLFCLLNHLSLFSRLPTLYTKEFLQNELLQPPCRPLSLSTGTEGSWLIQRHLQWLNSSFACSRLLGFGWVRLAFPIIFKRCLNVIANSLLQKPTA
jgi:hypothetical protein